MTKKLFYLFIIIAVFISSCNNESIDIEEVKKIHYYDITINTINDEVYNFDDDVKSHFSWDLTFSDDSYFSVTTLLYDSDGLFVDSICTHSKTYKKSVIQKFKNIPVGDYTVVSIVYVVDRSEGFKSVYWNIDGMDRLTTLKLIDKDKYLEKSLSIVGVGCLNLTHTIDQTYISTPKSIGSVVYMQYEGFENSDYEMIGLYRKDKVDGYMINPTLSNKERYYYDDYNVEHTWSWIGSSADMKDRITSSNVNLYFILGDDINWCFGLMKDINSTNFTLFKNSDQHYQIKPGETYYAYFRNNKYNGGDVFWGTYNEKNTWYSSLAQVALFQEPCVQWGTDLLTVQNYMADYQAGSSSVIKESDSSYKFVYLGQYGEYEIDYYFTSEETGLYMVYVLFDGNKVQIEDILEHFNNMPEKYIYKGLNSGIYYYLSKDNKTELAIYKNEMGSWTVRYNQSGSE